MKNVYLCHNLIYEKMLVALYQLQLQVKCTFPSQLKALSIRFSTYRLKTCGVGWSDF